MHVDDILADDATIMRYDQNTEKLDKRFNKDIVRVSNWCESNRLSFNLQKTSFLTFKCILDSVNLHIGSSESKILTKRVYLYINSMLTFEKHISFLRRKISSRCYAIKLVSNELDLSAA